MNSNLFKQEVTSGKKILSIELNSNQDLDLIALKTLVNDCSQHLVPISYFEVDGKVILKYDCHKLLDFKYLPSKLTLNEYLHLLESLTNFLLDCYDWFINRQSLYFNPDYIYYEKEDLTLKLIYLPIKKQFTPANQLQEFYSHLIKDYQVENGDKLQYELLKGIIEPSFTINNISNIINNFKQQDQERLVRSTQQPINDKTLINQQHKCIENPRENTEDSLIHSIEKDEPIDTENIYEMLKGSSSDKLTKHKKKKINRPKKPGLWQKLFSDKKQKIHQNNENIVQEEIEIATFQRSRAKIHEIPLDDLNDTEIFSTQNGTRYYLKLVDSSRYNNLPLEIDIELNNSFTIGRQDYQRGESSTFEFDSSIKSISRIHARIDKENDQLFIVDLHSSNGTFVNNTKLIPNIPVQIKEKDIIKLSPKIIYKLLVR